MIQVKIPTPLREYTGNQGIVEAEGATLAGLLGDLERRYPGIRFRMIDEQDKVREHIKFFVNQREARTLDAPLGPGDKVSIILAISGG